MTSPTQKVQICVLMYFSLPTLPGAFLEQLSFLIQWMIKKKVQRGVIMYFSLPKLLGDLRAAIILYSMASPTHKVQIFVLM